jgi:hypothetical protein
VKQLVFGLLILSATLAGTGLVAGCGGQKGTLSVDILVPVAADPFRDATQAVITVGDPPIMQRIVPVSSGSFVASIQFDVKSGSPLAGPVIVEARDNNSRVLGYGRTPVLALVPVDEVVTVWVGRPGQAGRSPSDLTRGRVDMAVGPIPRLGVLLAGGTVNGVATGDAEVYHQYTHEVLKAEAVPTPRRGAAVIGYDRLAFSTGASLLVSGATTAPTDEVIVFDPVATGSTSGRWTTLAPQGDILKRIAPAVAQIPGGTWLLCGGVDGGGLPLNTAAQVSVGNQIIANPTSTMAAPRVGAKAIGGRFSSEDGALIIGGNPDGTATIERFVASNRTFTPVTGSEQLVPRTGHSVTQLANGEVVVTGGHESGGPPALASGWIINPANLGIVRRDNLLSTPRSGHVTFVAGRELVACGGVDDQNRVLANCEALDGTTLAPGGPDRISTTVPRTDLVAMPLETGDILLVGGVDEGGRPVTAIEIYTPVR